jgi:hypothetical protein
LGLGRVLLQAHPAQTTIANVQSGRLERAIRRGVGWGGGGGESSGDSEKIKKAHDETPRWATAPTGLLPVKIAGSQTTASPTKPGRYYEAYTILISRGTQWQAVMSFIWCGVSFSPRRWLHAP